MKLTKRKGDTSTVRKVWDDDKTRCYGVVGTIQDLIDCGIMEYSDYDHNLWCFIPATAGATRGVHFGKTRDESLEYLYL